MEWIRHLKWNARARASIIALLVGCSGLQAAAGELKMGGTGTALGTLHPLAEAFAKQHPDVKVTILPNLGSTGGIKAAMKGAVDIGVEAAGPAAAVLAPAAR